MVELLRMAAAEGRLNADELDQRLDAALAARTDGDLEPLTADLPATAEPVPPRAGRGMRDEVRAYLAVMALLVAIWALTGAGYFWPVWPALGWGLGLGLCVSPGHTRARRHTAA